MVLIAANRFPNQLRKALIERQFAVTFEVTTPRPDQPLDEIEGFARALACEPRVAAVAVTDRVRSDNDRDPVEVAGTVAEASGRQALVHWAGKARTPADLADSLRRAEAAGLDSFLMLTGDKVRKPLPGHTPYLDAVNQIVQARAAQPDLLLGVAVGSFKYREEEQLNQYIKLAKKARVGADFAIGQIGFDMAKLRDLMGWLRMRGLTIPVLASFMPLTPGVAERIHSGRIPGITVTDTLLRRVREESGAADKGHAVRVRRLALQLLFSKRIGMAGAQITGIHSGRRCAELLDLVDSLDRELPDDAAWQSAWDDTLRLADGSLAETAPEGAWYWGQSLASAVTHGDRVPAQPGLGERAKFKFMDLIHRTCFEDGAPAAGLLGAASRIDLLEPVLTGAEIATKKPIAGCQTCGFCRLPYTQYVCPETCPKGLANGPCGGTTGNRCEFGDRECIHNVRYRLAKAAGRLNDLEELIVPPVPDTRGTCSWTNHFEGRDPVVIRLKPNS